ncbi:MAG: glycerophosphodiester phosphodiesterase family protein [Anaerolineales bacterium]
MSWAVLIHALVFLAFWLTNLTFRDALNRFLAEVTGLQMNYLSVFLACAAAMALWSAARLVFRRADPRSGWHRLDRVLDVFFLLFFYGSFAALFLKNPIQLARLGQLLQYFRLVVDFGLLLLLAWGLRRWVKERTTTRKILSPLILLFLWSLPLLWPPGNVYHRALPEKPRLIAHRGASTLAPENTLAAMRAAAALPVYGLETDIRITRDGVLFLMHDATLRRTTNVAEVFPGRADEPAESFAWEELSRLDAGSWFAGTTAFRGEPIPTLEEMLALVAEHDLVFIYDLRIPVAGHPYAAQALDLCLQKIEAAGVAPRTWILTRREEIAHIRNALPEAVLATGVNYWHPPSPADLKADGYQVVNSEYGLSTRAIRAYRQAGLWVNLWTVDEAWQYSRLWLAGADSVTSNRVQVFASMPRPLAALAYPAYLLVWGGLGLLALGVLLIKKRVAV